MAPTIYGFLLQSLFTYLDFFALQALVLFSSPPLYTEDLLEINGSIKSVKAHILKMFGAVAAPVLMNLGGVATEIQNDREQNRIS